MLVFVVEHVFQSAFLLKSIKLIFLDAFHDVLMSKILKKNLKKNYFDVFSIKKHSTLLYQ